MLAGASKGYTLPLILVVAVAFGLAGFLIRDAYFQLVLALVPIWAAFGLTWNIFSGYTGLISFGHSVFFGLGAFTVAFLSHDYGVSPWLSIPLGGLIGGIASIVIGAITFRLRGHYFALAMLAYPSLFIFLFDWLGKQELTFPLHREAPWLHLQFDDQRVYLLIGLALMTALMIMTVMIERSRFGMAMLSIKQNELAAEAAGIDTFRTKLIAFLISGATAAIVGGFYATVLRVVTPHGVFGMLVSAQALIFCLFGGVGTVWGAVIGAAVLIPMTEMLRAELGHILPGIQGVVYGITIMLVILLAPEGVYWRARDLLAARAPRRPALEPSVAPCSASSGPVPRVAGEGPLLEVRGLTKQFGGLKAVQDVSFAIEQDVIVGIIGPNGAGKTTLFNVLNGIQPPTAGQVFFRGKNLAGLAPNEVCHLGIGRTFQVARPFTRMTALENVLVGALSSTEGREDAIRRAQAALDTVGLRGKAMLSVSALTNLDLRLMELARALASRPTLLLLDEPLAGLGGTEVEEILPVIKRLPAAGASVVIIEHTMDAMTRLADRFIVLDHGQIIATGKPSEVMQQPAVIEAYLGKRWMDAHAQG